MTNSKFVREVFLTLVSKITHYIPSFNVIIKLTIRHRVITGNMFQITTVGKGNCAIATISMFGVIKRCWLQKTSRYIIIHNYFVLRLTQTVSEHKARFSTESEGNQDSLQRARAGPLGVARVLKQLCTAERTKGFVICRMGRGKTHSTRGFDGNEHSSNLNIKVSDFPSQSTRSSH